MCRGIRGSEATALLNVGLPVGMFTGTVLKMVDLCDVLDAVGMFKGSALKRVDMLIVLEVGLMNFERGEVKSNS